jgi:hypothetical protein
VIILRMILFSTTIFELYYSSAFVVKQKGSNYDISLIDLSSKNSYGIIWYDGYDPLLIFVHLCKKVNTTYFKFSIYFVKRLKSKIHIILGGNSQNI